MFLDNIKKKLNEITETVNEVISEDNIAKVKNVATNALNAVKTGVSCVVDCAIEAINSDGDTQRLDDLHAKQREEIFTNLYNDLINNDSSPDMVKPIRRLVNWVKNLPDEDAIHYYTLVVDGDVTVNKDGQIDGPDFYVLPDSNIICYKPKNRDSSVIGIYTSVDNCIDDGYKAEEIFCCRVTVPNAKCDDERFPFLCMICPTGNRADVKKDYIDFIMSNEEKYHQAMDEHRNDSRNIRHTEWRSNVNVYKYL